KIMRFPSCLPCLLPAEPPACRIPAVILEPALYATATITPAAGYTGIGLFIVSPLPFCSAAQFADALARRDDVRQADAELLVHHHHFALRDQITVYQYVHGLPRQTIQFH